jgi:hypothetical protein
VLEANGGSWREPPATVEWPHKHRVRRDEIIAQMSAAAPPGAAWGFKDPRTLLTLDGWLEALPDLRFVGMVRDPESVARSLFKRTGLARPHAIGLWTEYNRRLLAYRRRFDVPIVRFDVPAPALIEALRAVCLRLGLPGAAAESFFESDLRHHQPAGAEAWDDVSSEVRALYDALCADAL